MHCGIQLVGSGTKRMPLPHARADGARHPDGPGGQPPPPRHHHPILAGPLRAGGACVLACRPANKLLHIAHAHTRSSHTHTRSSHTHTHAHTQHTRTHALMIITRPTLSFACFKCQLLQTPTKTQIKLNQAQQQVPQTLNPAPLIPLLPFTPGPLLATPPKATPHQSSTHQSSPIPDPPPPPISHPFTPCPLLATPPSATPHHLSITPHPSDTHPPISHPSHPSTPY